MKSNTISGMISGIGNKLLGKYRQQGNTENNTNTKEKSKMLKKNGKKLSRGEKITSTSNVTIDDIVDYVADNLPVGSIEGIVRRVVRPCAIGGVPTVIAGQNGKSAVGAPCGSGRVSFSGGNGGCTGRAGVVVPGCDGDEIVEDVRHSSPNLATTSKWFNTVLQNGEVWTPYTSRRFLPAQYLAMMDNYNGNISAAIARRYSLRDCFKLLDTEIEKLIFMERNWRTAYLERSQFLTVRTICTIFNEYLNALKANINDRSKCQFNRRNGAFWRKIQGEGTVELWKQTERKREGDDGLVEQSTSIVPTDWLVNLNAKIEIALNKVEKCGSYETALDILRTRMPQISMGTFKDADGNIRYWLPKAWKAAFMKQGAYYTLKSLIVNKHVRFTTETGSWNHRETNSCDNARDGLNRLRELQSEQTPAYVVHAILKKSIEVSKFNVSKFLRQIRKH